MEQGRHPTPTPKKRRKTSMNHPASMLTFPWSLPKSSFRIRDPDFRQSPFCPPALRLPSLSSRSLCAPASSCFRCVGYSSVAVSDTSTIHQSWPILQAQRIGPFRLSKVVSEDQREVHGTWIPTRRVVLQEALWERIYRWV